MKKGYSKEEMILALEVKSYMLEHNVSRKQAYKEKLVPKELQLSKRNLRIFVNRFFKKTHKSWCYASFLP